MVKVLENSVVDLDVMPGKDQVQMQQALRQQAEAMKAGGG